MKARESRLSVLILVVLVVFSTVLTGCELFSRETGKLKVGVLPILDVLPLYVAEQEGYFEAGGVEVELVPFSSALERDVALQTDQIDGEVNDLISVALLNNDGDRAKVVRTAMRATPEKSMFAILSSDEAIKTPTDLQGVQIGMSTNSVIEYIVDRLLEAEGLTEADIVKEGVPKIPVRMELLSNGSLPAACLPEPLASLAAVSGAHIVIDDRTHPEYAQSVVSFSTRTLDEKPTMVKRFLSAYEKAVEAINADPDGFRPLLIEKGRVPKPVQDSFDMPVFPGAGVPTEAEVQDVLEWMIGKDMLERELAYDKLVSDKYLP